MGKKKGFTLLELIIVIAIFGFVIVVVLRSFVQMLDIKNAVQARQELIESSYFMMERLHTVMKNYTIDYEEYFNRRMVGCDELGDYQDTNLFSWSGGFDGSCNRFTNYGNSNSIGGSLGGTLIDDEEHRLYYCSSLLSSDENSSFVKVKSIPSSDVTDFLAGSGCFMYNSSSNGWQSFGQYAANFYDVQDDVDFVVGAFNDDDDKDLGTGPAALVHADEIQEIYLISKDNRNRLFLRRKLIGSGDWNRAGGVGDVPSDLLYSIQLLKLRGFDAGHNHDFSTTNSTGVYDGVVDTWACDHQAGFVCGDSNRDGIVDNSDNFDSIADLYSGYVIPLHEDDGWVTLFDSHITVTDWNIQIYPTKNPDLSWSDDEYQINPHITIALTTALYGKNWFARIGGEPLDAFTMTLETTFDIKSFY